MTRRWRGPAVVALPAAVVALALGVACGRDDPIRVTSTPRPPKPVVETPVDRLAPGEIEPSDELAFGLPIPKGMRVRARFEGETIVEGTIDHDELVEYLKRRLTTSHVTYEPDRVVFDDVTLRDAPTGEDEGRTLRIEIRAKRKMIKMRVLDTTPPPSIKGLTETERWRRVGLNPDGSPLDPDSLR